MRFAQCSYLTAAAAGLRRLYVTCGSVAGSLTSSVRDGRSEARNNWANELIPKRSLLFRSIRELTYVCEGEAASMRQVLFVQGGGEDVHDQWDNRLAESLRSELGPTYEIRYPVMPNEADPSYAVWKRALQNEFAALEDGAIVVGHSVGGTILIHVLAERTPQFDLGAVCLIAAPFIGTGGWTSDDIEPRPDLADRLPRGVPIFFYHGRNDDTVPFSHVELYARAVPRAQVRRLAGRDHQLNNGLSEIAADIRWLDQRSSADAAREAADPGPPRGSTSRDV